MTEDTIQERRLEIAEKLTRVRAFLDREDLDGVLLSRQTHVSWIAAGLEDDIERNIDPGLVQALITRDRTILLTQNIEAPRIIDEESAEELGFELVVHDWWAEAYYADASRIVAADRLANDGFGPGRDASFDLQMLRLKLTEGEQKRLRVLAKESTNVVEANLRTVTAGTTETELAARIANGLQLLNIEPLVLLVGADDRREKYRHPTISSAPIDSGALAVLVGVRGGLNVALTRTISLGRVPQTLAERHEAAASVEAAMVLSSSVGATYGEALQAGIDEYATQGYPGEWKSHFQGGGIGYHSREISPAPLSAPNPSTSVAIEAGHAVAWNPTVQGAKTEDTFLIGATGSEWVTQGDWPEIDVRVNGSSFTRPAILEI